MNNTMPAQEAEALMHVRALVEFAYQQGFHELGYDPVKVLEDAAAVRPTGKEEPDKKQKPTKAQQRLTWLLDGMTWTKEADGTFLWRCCRKVSTPRYFASPADDIQLCAAIDAAISAGGRVGLQEEQ